MASINPFEQKPESHVVTLADGTTTTVQANRCAVLSKSSQKYLNGGTRNQGMSYAATVGTGNPYGEPELNWFLTAVPGSDNAGYWTLLSASSGGYLDVGIDLGIYEASLALVSECQGNANDNQGLHWRIEAVDGCYSLYARVKGRYLDGRDVTTQPPEVWVTGRPPAGDGFLQWSFIAVPGLPNK